MTDAPDPQTRRLTWHGAEPAPFEAPGAGGWARAVLRGVPLVLFVLTGLLLTLVLRLVERPVFGLHRPLTPKLTRAVCRGALAILGIGYRVTGRPMAGRGAMVANHSSWLDIFALNAPAEIYFVSKEEVGGWPGIGWLAKATGTVFIKRERREATAQVKLMRERLAAGHRLSFFPEGTSTDGRRVLPFKPTLFAAFLSPDQPDLEIQPVSLVYRAAEGGDPRFYGWWGDMEFGPHMLKMLAARRHGTIEVIYHAPVRVADHPDRKALARRLEADVRAGLEGAGALEDQPAMAEA
ncbi:lysophospholipid acyltransferase family protein [Limimaricola pyoseonensis]|uniref:Lyso-ornithine lipid acyltransferase n=1 Tax=Limimaricola pyoseonensis TaxID=521013 RepID=A0A1G7A565_9RHOB|nr:lysophospholipid acyltransferase family protein [Limimaricola pyoseonensis]SDE09195.1 lyso-ornithine lipid acyltransferase [Limimaricola pyoseonensis]